MNKSINYPHMRHKGRQCYAHIIIWQNYHRRIVPKGYEIHHKDGNRLNNSITNLELLSLATIGELMELEKNERQMVS